MSVITMPDPFEPQHVEGFTLADYVVAFLGRWKLFTITVLFFLIGGVVMVRQKSLPPVPFPYTTVLEIGRFADGMLLEDLNVVRTRFQSAYIPKVLREHAVKGQYDQEQYGIAVQVSQGSEEKGSEEKGRFIGGAFVILETRGSAQDKDEILLIHQDIVNLLLQDHERKAELVKRELEREKFQAELKLEELKAREGFFPRRHKTLDDTAKLLQAQIDATASFVSSLEKDRSTALASAVSKGTVDQSLATTLLLTDTDITRNREKIRELEERLEVNVPKERTILEQEELDNKRSQKEQEQTLSEIDFKITNIQKTALALAPSQLLKGPKQVLWQKTMLVALGAGLAVAFFIVWITELAVNAKRYTHLR